MDKENRKYDEFIENNYNKRVLNIINISNRRDKRDL